MAFLNSISYRAVRERIGAPSLAQVWESRPGLLLSLCAITLIASMMLGGGTRSGFLSDTVLQLIAIPAFLAALSSLTALPWRGGNRAAEWGVMLCLGAVILPLVQLVPLPPWIWTRLPHREQITGVFDMLRQPLPWLPISVAPSLTWAALISLLPPLAIFFGVIQLGYRQRRLISLVIVAMGILSAFLGLLQVAQGPSSPWRFFAVTNATEAVGFFANRNHLAALLYSVLMFGAAWAINLGYSAGSSDARRFETASVVTLIGSFLTLVILIAAEGSTRSRAGLGLMIVALFGALWLAMSDRRRSSTSTPVKLIVGSAIFAVLLIVQFALVRIVARFEDPLEGARIPIAENTIAAAEAYMPFGSGLGTFVTVYPGFEPLQDALDNKYVNHAHDDLLEVILEGGAMSLLMMGGFTLWFFLVATNTWRRPPEDARGIDVLLGRAATLVVPLILIHSVVDYPLRTGGMMAVFALACGFLVTPLQFGPKEIEPELTPALEISEAERRRLARLRGGAAIADVHAGMLALPEEEPPVEPVDFADEATMFEPSPDEHDTPVDLDELAGLLEPAAGIRRPPNSQKTILEAAETVDQVATGHDHDAADPAPQVPAATGRQVAAKIARPQVSGKSVGEMAYLLAQVNQLSDVLVERSNHLAQGGSVTNSPGDGRVLTAAEAVDRRLRVLHAHKRVQPPASIGAADEAGSSGATPSPTRSPSKTASDAVSEQTSAPAASERRKQVLRSVERFIQTTTAESDEATLTGESDDAGRHTEADSFVASADSLLPPRAGRQTENAELPPPIAMPVARAAADEAISERPDETARNSAAVDQAAGKTEIATASLEDEAKLAATDGEGELIDVLQTPGRPESESETLAAMLAAVGSGDRSASEAEEMHVEAPPGPTRVATVAGDARGDARNVERPAGPSPDTDFAAPADAAASEDNWDGEIEWPQPRQFGDAEGAPPNVPKGQDPIESWSIAAANDRELVNAEVSDSPRARPARQASPEAAPQQKAGNSLAVKPPPAARPAKAGLGEAPALPETARWGGDIEWPDEWKK